ncbi:MAG: OmpH family outer membrane protein [Prevotella sp.]|nr:OmpH family outer membrane protein [Prevotella sp.]MBR1556533.1 OmpH family outer membrane protein [Prevotella sp.]
MKRFLVLLVAFVSLNSFAQDEATPASSIKFGYLSYQAAIKSMPDYALVQQELTDLRAKYQAEAKRVEDEFNRKYEEFLEGQRDFPKSILQKRQSELQELLEKNIAFKNKSREQLAKDEADAFAPLYDKLNTVLAAIGQEKGFAFILDTDVKALPFINPAMGEDINEAVKEGLQEEKDADK